MLQLAAQPSFILGLQSGLEAICVRPPLGADVLVKWADDTTCAAMFSICSTNCTCILLPSFCSVKLLLSSVLCQAQDLLQS